MKLSRLIFFSLLLCFAKVFAQMPKEAKLDKGFSVRFYRPTPTGKVLEAICSGSDAKPLSGSNEILVHQFEMKTFRESTGDKPQLIAQAPECRLDQKTRLAHSDGHLQVFTPTTNFFIEGQGFFCSYSNSFLVISNQVETRIDKAIFKSPGLATGPANVPASGELLKIFADHFEFHYNTNLVIYSGNVRVLDSQMPLTCELLTAQFSTNGTIENIWAEHNVSVTTTNQGRATADRATYVLSDGSEAILLTGDAHWSDPQADLRADSFFINRQEKTILAEKNAHLKIPRAAMIAPELLGTKTNRIATDAVVEISSESMFIALPSAKRTARYMSARTNVTILSAADNSRAAGETALFDEASGTVTLSENASWETEQFVARAQTLLLDRTNRVLKANREASLKILPTKTANTQPATDISCEYFELSTNEANFHGSEPGLSGGRVRMNFSEHGTPGELRCDDLKAHLAGNQVENAVAKGDVQFEQPPSRKLTCKTLTLERASATGRLRRIRAENDVVLEEFSRDARTNEERPTKIFAELLDAHFAGATNAVEEMFAEKNVRFESAGNLATGQRAVYKTSGGREILELSGQPIATISKPGNDGKTKRFQWSESKTLIWEGPTGTFFRQPTNGVLRSTGGFKLVPLD